MSDKRVAPGIKTRKFSDPLLAGARTDPLLMPLVSVMPFPQKRRKGLRLLIRRLCYFILSRT